MKPSCCSLLLIALLASPAIHAAEKIRYVILVDGGRQAGEQVVERGHDRQTVERVRRMLYLSEYKRRQSPPGAKVSPSAFTRERRYPIVNGYQGKIKT